MLTQLPACSVLTHLPCLPAPAGSGKIHLVRALAAEAGLPIVTLNGGECVGENAEKNMRRAFSSGASAARPACPACTLVWCSVSGHHSGASEPCRHRQLCLRPYLSASSLRLHLTLPLCPSLPATLAHALPDMQPSRRPHASYSWMSWMLWRPRASTATLSTSGRPPPACWLLWTSCGAAAAGWAWWGPPTGGARWTRRCGGRAGWTQRWAGCACGLGWAGQDGLNAWVF
jgi:hypothetical protein